MKVKELIKELQKQDPEKDVIIKFALDEYDEIGYTLEQLVVYYSYFQDKVLIIGDTGWNQEDYDFIGQANLQKLWREWYNKETED